MGYYPSLREYVQTLESRQQLFRIQREVCRETSSTHLVHWQFRGLPESERRAFLFEKVAGVSRKEITPGSVYDFTILRALNDERKKAGQ